MSTVSRCRSATPRCSLAITQGPPDDDGLYPCSTGAGGLTANYFRKISAQGVEAESNDPAATASATQAAIMATPPIGVIAPSHFNR